MRAMSARGRRARALGNLVAVASCLAACSSAETGSGGDATADASLDATPDAPDAADGDTRRDAVADAADASDASRDGEVTQDADTDASSPLGPAIVSSRADTYVEAESALALGPSGRAVVAFIGFTSAEQTSTVGYAFSSDDGATFTAPALVGAAPGVAVEPLQWADPSAAFDDGGGAWLAWLGYPVSPTGASYRILVARAAPGVDAFTEGVAADDGTRGVDRPSIAVDAAGRAFVAWSESTTGVVVASTTDGAAFARTRAAAGTNVGYVALCADRAGATGRIYVAYDELGPTLDGGGYDVHAKVARSDDGAAHFGAPVRVDAALPAYPTSLDAISCVARGEDLWIAYATSSDAVSETADDMMLARELVVAHSSDAGATFDRRNAVAHAAPLDAARWLHPALVDDASGTLALFAYEGAAPDDARASFRAWVSSDGARTFGASTALSAPSLHLLSARSSLRWLGDYAGVGLRAGDLHAAFASNEGTASHVVYARRPVR